MNLMQLAENADELECFLRDSLMIRRRSDFDAIRKWAWPAIAAVLALFLWGRDAMAAEVVRCPDPKLREVVPGLDGKQLAYVQTRFTNCPLQVFTVKFDLPSTPNPRGWW